MPYFFELDNVDKWAGAKNVFSKDECEKIINLKKEYLRSFGKVGNDEVSFKIRKSNICWIPYDKEKTGFIYDKLYSAITEINNKFFNFHLTGILEDLQLTEYASPDGHYDYHNDIAFGFIARKLSVSVQLTDPNEYEGGELELFYQKEPIHVSKEQGDLIIFPSYTMHKVLPVTKGIRHSLVAWVSGNPFK